MPKRAAGPILAIELDPASETPLHRQLYLALRAMILGGRFAPGSRLPSTRAFAADLRVSRNTVLAAVSQLRAEGFVECRTGSGTSIPFTLPGDLRLVTTSAPLPRPGTRARTLSRRGRRLANTVICATHPPPTPFQPGAPALDEFPRHLWARIASRYWHRPPRAALGYADAQGFTPLRQAVADYLAASRGVRCTAEQVVIVAGSQVGLYLSAQLLLEHGDRAWLEDPGYPGARAALTAAGARIVPVPVDAEGIRLDARRARDDAPRLIFVTPSHQYPLGVTMSLNRRVALLRFARRAGAWIIEDDYDGEYRYASRPIASLQGLDGGERVIYIGSFSKVLFPALRLGYLVAPPELVEPYCRAHAALALHAPLADQAATADFIVEGHFERHVRRMRALYAERQRLLVECAARELGGLLRVEPQEAGKNIVGWLPEGWADEPASRAVADEGVLVTPLSRFAIRGRTPAGFLLDYAGFDERELAAGVRGLRRGLERYAGQSGGQGAGCRVQEV